MNTHWLRWGRSDGASQCDGQYASPAGNGARTGFGLNSDWVLNIKAKAGEEVTAGLQNFAASHRFLGEEEAVKVIAAYEYRNRVIAAIVCQGLSWLLGWKYRGGEGDRRQLVRQIPLIAFRPRTGAENIPLPVQRSA